MTIAPETTASLPTPGPDDVWGNQLNGWCLVAHNPDGTINYTTGLPPVVLEAQSPGDVPLTIKDNTGTTVASVNDTGQFYGKTFVGGAADAASLGSYYTSIDNTGLTLQSGGAGQRLSTDSTDALSINPGHLIIPGWQAAPTSHPANNTLMLYGLNNTLQVMTQDGTVTQLVPAAGGGGGAPPATTVAGPPAFGAAPVVGTGTNYARNDHVHGLPAAPTASGAASGDLSGTYPGPTVAKVNGIPVTGTPTTGQVITATSPTAANWQTPPSAGGGPPSGAASGDLSGSYPGPTVAKVNGVAVTGTPSVGMVPTATGAAAATWQTPPAAPGPAATVTGPPSYGQAAVVGTGTTYARVDHVHGLPAAPTLSPPVTLTATTVGMTPLTVSGMNGQTGDIFDAMGFGGTSGLKVLSQGQIYATNPITANVYHRIDGGLALGGATAWNGGQPTNAAIYMRADGAPAVTSTAGVTIYSSTANANQLMVQGTTGSLYSMLGPTNFSVGPWSTGGYAGGGSGPMIAMYNATTEPTTNHGGGVYLYAFNGVLKCRDNAGGVTQIAPSGGNIPSGTANAQVPFWNGSAYVPALTTLNYPSTAKPSGGTNPGHFVLAGLDNGGTLWWDKADGSGYQQAAPAINAVPNMPVLINGTLGTGTALPTAPPGLVAHNLNLRAGANITITGIQDATNDMNTITIAASGGGGGAACLGSNMVNIASAQALTGTAAQIGTSAVTFTATTTAVIFEISLYVTTPTASGNITMYIQQTAGNAAQVTAGTTGQVQFVGSGTSGTNAASGTSTTKLCGNFPNNNSINVSRLIYITGMIVGQAYTWQPFASSAGTAAAIGQDLVTVTVVAA